MRTPKEVLQQEVNDMLTIYNAMLKNRPHKGQSGYEKSKYDRANINKRINEFNNAISKLL